MWTSAAVAVVITGLYTIFGGLRAVIYTEVMQAIVLIVGSAALDVHRPERVGGWSGLDLAAGGARLHDVEAVEPS